MRVAFYRTMIRQYRAANYIASTSLYWGLTAVVIMVILVNASYWNSLSETARWLSSDDNRKVRPIEVGGLSCERPIWNFGTVDLSVLDGTLTHQFLVTNTSGNVQTISGVRSSCGCMLVSEPRKSIALGECTLVGIVVTLPPRPGPFRKGLLIDIDGCDSPLPLQIFGTVTGVRPLGVAPASLNFGNVKRGETKQRSIILLRYDAIDASMLTVRSSDPPSLRCELINSADGRPCIRVDLSSINLHPGPYTGEISIDSQDNQRAKASIRVTASIE